MSWFVAYAAVSRALLLGRLTLTFAAVGVGVGLVDDFWQSLGSLAVVAGTTMVQLTVLSRWPTAIRWRLCVIAVDAVPMIGVLLLSRGGVAYFCYAAGHAALAGALLGVRGLPLWIADAGLGLAVAMELLRAGGREAATSIAAPFMLAFPMIDIVCGIAAAVVTAALARYIDTSVAAVTAVQHSTAASERTRLARELHDSVAKTLRGVSFAAVALPSLLRRQPDLAEQLAATVSLGADTAVREARELLSGLRRDAPDRPFSDVVRGICRAWSSSAGIPVRVTATAVNPPVAVRYELTQILNEALQNVARHARASQVWVDLNQPDGHVELTIRDNGSGFTVPGELTELSASGNFGVIGMTERAQAVGGTLRVDSSAGAGTRLVTRVPLTAVDPAASRYGQAVFP
ncbi:signal transduction histidine kinase [Micromonospora luteifusca]|uniref:Signal transduction histidine kinase n=1 Tax=Micromonospora luteifusca TaxID=709860 RepID=A0ABS2LMQ5_9ACTN|nr:ATP-binding protein [Micromonospora luteifusca]MBM7489476.1 signal transduction histidine kinase [Micromonospora luteifusca]